MFNRHEVLRTIILEDEESNIYQKPIDFSNCDLPMFKSSFTDKKLMDIDIDKEERHIFNLASEFPVRMKVYEIIGKQGTEHYFNITFHHIAFDAWSLDIFWKELELYYDRYTSKSNPTQKISPLLFQYKDFGLWQRSYLTGDVFKDRIDYWRCKLENYETLNLLPQSNRNRNIDYKGCDIFFELSENTSTLLRTTAKILDVSLFSVLLAGYYLMLRVFSGQNDITIGSPFSNRHFNETHDLIGCFVNTVVLRVKISSEEFITEFIRKINTDIHEIQQYQDLPFERLVQEIGFTRLDNRNPIFQIMFGLREFGSQVGNGKLKKLLSLYQRKNDSYKVAKFDLCTFLDDSQIRIKGCI